MKKSRALLFLFFVLIAGSMTLAAQSNEIIDDLLAEEEASFGKSVYLALVAADLIPEEATPEEAVAVLEEYGWKVKIWESEEPIRLGEYSFIIMKAFHMQGGLMYSIIPCPRYACRELSYLKLIPGSSSPYRTLSGEEAVRILGYVLEWKEERL